MLPRNKNTISLVNTKNIAYNNTVNELSYKLDYITRSKRYLTFVGSEGRCGSTSVLLGVAPKLSGRTLVIDCNLRRSCIGRYTGIEGRGLAEYIADGVETVYKYTDNVDIVPAGNAAGREERVLSSADRLRELGGNYEHILIDTPSLSEYPDALTVGAHSDGVIMVVPRGAPIKKFAAAIADLKAVGADIVGIVLNNK